MVTFLLYVASDLVTPRYLTDIMKERERDCSKLQSNWKSQATEMPSKLQVADGSLDLNGGSPRQRVSMVFKSQSLPV